MSQQSSQQSHLAQQPSQAPPHSFTSAAAHRPSTTPSGSQGQQAPQPQQFMADPNEMISDMSDTMSKSSSTTKKRTRKFKNKQANPHKVDQKAKLERSRQSARECRARKKLRYQYLEDLVTKREAANIALKKEIDSLQGVATLLSTGRCSKEEIERKFASI